MRTPKFIGLKNLIKEMGAKEVKWKSNVKLKPFEPGPYFKPAYDRIISGKSRIIGPDWKPRKITKK